MFDEEFKGRWVQVDVKTIHLVPILVCEDQFKLGAAYFWLLLLSAEHDI